MNKYVSICLSILLLVHLSFAQSIEDDKVKQIDKIVTKIEAGSNKLKKYVAYDSVRQYAKNFIVSWADILEYYTDKKSNQYVKLVAASKAGSKNPYKTVYYYENKRIIKILVREQRVKNQYFPNGVNVESALYYDNGRLIRQLDEKEKFTNQKVIYLGGLEYVGYKS